MSNHSNAMKEQKDEIITTYGTSTGVSETLAFLPNFPLEDFLVCFGLRNVVIMDCAFLGLRVTGIVKEVVEGIDSEVRMTSGGKCRNATQMWNSGRSH